jgi:hypothetical protein
VACLNYNALRGVARVCWQPLYPPRSEGVELGVNSGEGGERVSAYDEPSTAHPILMYVQRGRSRTRWGCTGGQHTVLGGFQEPTQF